jgi:hypothetical protein
MSDIAKGFGWLGLGLIVLFLLGLASFGSYEYFAPRYTAVDNRVYHESQQYTDGKRQRLDEFYQSYQSADDAGKASIKSIVEHEYAEFPESKLDPYLRNFLDQMRAN